MIKKIKKDDLQEKYISIIDTIDYDLDEFQQFRFIMILFNNLMAFLGNNFGSVDEEKQYDKLLKAYNILMEILKENDDI